jgi:glycerol kinase
MASRVPDHHGVYMVPAFVGFGAPYWEPDSRAAIYGLTFDSSAAYLARASLEAVAYQTQDLFDAMVADGCASPATLRVDGGMTANTWLCQFLADISQLQVQRPQNQETTAAGAAFLAGLAIGVWSDLQAVANSWAARDTFEPMMKQCSREALLRGWNDAVTRTLPGIADRSD